MATIEASEDANDQVHIKKNIYQTNSH